MSTAGVEKNVEVLAERARLVAVYTRQGFSAAEIATRLWISRRTVQRYQARARAGWQPEDGRPGPRPAGQPS